MKKEIKNGVLIITCDNLGEFFTEFTEYRNSKGIKNMAKEENFGDYCGVNNPFGIWTYRLNVEGNRLPENPVIAEVEIGLSNPEEQEKEISLVLKLSKEESEWKNKNYSSKIENVLKEIWINGEAKNYQDLDLNWPISQRNDNNKPPKNNSDKDKRIKYLEEKLEKETNRKIIWMAISITAVSVFSLMLLFCWLKIKKLKNVNDPS
jgi:hypothetical protein